MANMIFSGPKYVVVPSGSKFNIVLMTPFTKHARDFAGGYLSQPNLFWEKEVVISNKDFEESVKILQELNAGLV